MKQKLQNQIIYITGASAGIGLSTADLCLKEGATVVITGRNEERLKKAESILGKTSSNVVAHHLDVSIESDLIDSLNEIYKKFGRIDGLVNNAGVLEQKDFFRITDDELQNVLNNNFKSAFICTQEISELLERTPRALSGGQRQRVSIGRAIVREPDVFLFDEPLSNLDAALRVQTRIEIARLHERLGTTMIYVTHDQVEAMTLADKIVVLRDGRIEQVGSPITLYERPENKFVAQFIGSPKMNFFTTKDVNASAPAALKKKLDETTDLGIRPEHLTLCAEKSAVISGRLELVEQLGEYVLVHLETTTGTELIAKMPAMPKQAKGEMMHFKAELELCHLFDQNTGARK